MILFLIVEDSLDGDDKGFDTISYFCLVFGMGITYFTLWGAGSDPGWWYYQMIKSYARLKIRKPLNSAYYIYIL